MSNVNDYTVGWVCAIEPEYLAAHLCLDETHPNLDCHPSVADTNTYTLGKISGHNVVIACLPDGSYGTSPAANVANNMLRSFPNVRVGLMVGIGGGAPTARDIRLGDIVVSSPGDGKGGVIEYSFGKKIQEQDFQATGFLNRPPTALLTAVMSLKVEYKRRPGSLEAAIDRILGNEEQELQEEFCRPDASTDILYRNNFVHPADNKSLCSEVCGTDTRNVVSRMKRTKRPRSPVVHYGLIASGSQLVKDALYRDELSEKLDVLCFEMEAAGLMNDFPCLVIRGICDYSDSHKNNNWQGYASLAAAAYTKDLLSRISPSRIEAEKKILSDVNDEVTKLVRWQDEKEYETIMNWLTEVSYASEQEAFFSQRQQGTGHWLVDSTEFQTWVRRGNQTLFCPGIPGAGKTILTSIVVNRLHSQFENDSSIGIAYVYYSFRRKAEQRAEDMLASLLKQLAHRRASMPDSVKSLHQAHKSNSTRPLFDEISTTLHSVAALYSRVFIIVDALDECQTGSGCLAKFVREIFSLQGRCGANIFATSRPIPDVMDKFKGFISLEIRARNQDVRRYLDDQMSKLPRFVRNNEDLQDEIKAKIVETIDGMFLLARLHIDLLIGMRSPKAIRNALNDLAAGTEAYNNAYTDAMDHIESQATSQEELAKQVLSWITFAKRRLTASELQHALAIETGTSQLDETNMSEIDDILSVCAGLVTVDEESGIIRLVHYTAQEYFERTWKRWFPNVESDITTACATYLAFDAFQTGVCLTNKEFEERLRLYPFYDYAAHNWGHHARHALTAFQVVIDFLWCKANVDASIQALMAVKGQWNSSNYSQQVSRQMTGLHLAAYFGVKETVKAILRQNVDYNVTDGDFRTPLLWAARNGHEAVVQLLLGRSRIDVDFEDVGGQTALSWAAENGHDTVVKPLLDSGKANINSKDLYGRTPLSWAARNGHDAVVKLLLDTGRANVDSKNGYSRTPLSLAAENGHSAVVELLLDTGEVDINMKDVYSQTPLSLAAANGHDVVVKLLLDTDMADIESEDRGGQTPLTWAAENGHIAVVKLLLDTGKANVISKDWYGGTPLSWAAEYGHDAVVKLLLEAGKHDIEDEEGNGWTPLSRPTWNVHDASAKRLRPKKKPSR